MKILHISALQVWAMKGKGGMPSLRETLAGHRRAGHEIQLVLPQYDLFSGDNSVQHIRRDQGYVTSVAVCNWLPWIKRLKNAARRLTRKNTVPYPARWLLNLTMLVCLTFSLCREAIRLRRGGFEPDLIYAHNQYAALSGFMLAILWRIPNVTRLYGTFLADLMAKPFVELRYPTAAAGFLVPSSMLICANDGTRGDEVARRFRISSHRFRFWQNGVTPPSISQHFDRRELLKRLGEERLIGDGKWIVSCSRLSYWKRIDRMINAMAVVKEKNINCQLLVAGQGPELTRLKKLSEELNVSNYIIWLGALAHEDIWSLMKASDIFIITNDVTNRCNPLYEAAWAGLPVVSVFDPSTEDLLINRKNALLVNKDDTISLGERLVRLCTDTDLAERLKKEQRKLSESFWTWEERMKVEVKELDKLVEEHKNMR